MNLNRLDLEEVEEETVRMKSKLEWVSLDRVLPNPKNPRRDPSVRTKEMQNTIETIGWEEPITCYESGNNFIILSGHPRWYAAKQLKQNRIPIYIVKAPKSEAEEMDRIGSVQGGQVEWSPFDQIKYTHDRWIASGKMSFHDLANELGISKGLVKSRIHVYEYYPEDEVEEKLNNRMYSITMLDYIYIWIKRLKNYHPDIVESLGEHYIRRLMLKKYEHRCFNSQLVNDKTFVRIATPDAIREFLTDANKKLQDCQLELTYFRNDKINYSLIISEIKSIRMGTNDETEEILFELDKLLTCFDQMKIYFESKIHRIEVNKFGEH
ncbi:ParB/RepB/Spo0J family partition protein [Paenibacillus macerans]|uniref:ParB-like nuclease domain protein n=1 Tax=Paenibacillus macerans TaxID=44252 RepID=A0A090Y5R5_PAEMA|nr:ParB/RepB/Spo0J family partition protein [Paenibacillus macerans]KFM93814.1 parB-like nuclease domain protein [Paenibacillus macerans]MCY7562084.1 ParB/RepB/Spo0J family partition protein [Paenibacillus macerans]MEC0153825.1 ParB/RepB/Spo0J family partition protein [Paenibacillus macerans]SUA86345.1 ParB/RepB/Spo0J family partition protein [Paenibacillus macerans]GBK66042.1 hypothetical protein PbDSM24746_60460 [Paenibacillus macerans]